MGEIDNLTEAFIIIDFAHHEIHEGGSFFIDVFEEINNNAFADLAITTPDTAKHTHMFFEGEVESEMEFYAYEDPDITGGTSYTPVNRNRNSTNTSACTCVLNPTVNAVGMLLGQTKVGSGKKVGGRARGLVELILKQGATSLFRVENVSGAASQWVSSQYAWYEHTDSW